MGRGEALPLGKLSRGQFRKEMSEGVARVRRAQLATPAIRINHPASGIKNLIRRK